MPTIIPYYLPNKFQPHVLYHSRQTACPLVTSPHVPATPRQVEHPVSMLAPISAPEGGL